LRDRRIGVDRLRVLPLGLDLEPFARVVPLHGMPPPVVTLVARLVPVKDVAFFIRAARLVREARPDVRMQIAGDGPMRAELETAAPEWVEFLGQQSELPALLSGTGVVALSSRSEGSPVALIEALAAARPVVAVPVGGVPDVLHGRPGAVVTAARTPRHLADAIIAALADDTLAAGAAEGRDVIVERYGIDRLLREVALLYDELWSRRPRS
jgi:glycosyltransferase involved in cell wall biosynthesis